MASILCIDDDTIVLAVLRGLLEKHGHKVHTAECGFDGIESAQSNCPDLVVCDLMMPDLTGFDVGERLRAIDGMEDKPLIILTGRDTPLARKNVGYLGARFFAKPVTPASFMSLIDDLLSEG